jgi:hypothetical protein
MMRLSVSRCQQPEVTPVVPFKNKIQYYQLKQPCLITWNVERQTGICIKTYVLLSVDNILIQFSFGGHVDFELSAQPAERRSI